MYFYSFVDMILGVALAFAAIYFWNKNRSKTSYFLIVLAALFNYLYSFFRVLENIGLIPDDWYLSIGNFPVVKFLIISCSMFFLLIAIIKMVNENKNS